MRSICVCCGSSPGRDDAYVASARELGTTLATTGITVVYGGARVGLMGQVADAALAAGGEVVGVIPESMHERAGHCNLTTLHVVDTMHERKSRMYAAAEAFIALPGGLGTLDEVAEILTWSALEIHHKPCGLINLNGYFDPLLAFLDHAVDELFLKREHRDMLVTADTPDELLDKLRAYEFATIEE